MSFARALEVSLEFEELCRVERPQPHPIDLAPQARVIADSAKLGWREAYASIVSRRAWSGRIAPLAHLGIVYCLRGANRVERRLEDEPEPRVVEFQTRQLALLPSHAGSTFRVSGDADVLVVYIRGGMVRAVADRLFGCSNRPLHFQPAMAFNDPLLEQFCLAFAEAINRQRGETARYIDQIAESAAAHCLMRYPLAGATSAGPAPTGMETALGRVRTYVDEHLDGDLSVERLAAAASLSPSALKRAFALVHGATPKQWVIRRRIAHAREMLAATDLPLTEIALRAGFASQSHLSATFKREIGQTPRGYRFAD